MLHNRTLSLIAAVMATALTAAATEPADSLESQLREVSVTAIKHSARPRLQPMAMTSVNALQAQRLNISATKQLSEIAPNFYVPDYGSRMTSSIYVRGLGARIDVPVVGLNIDNIPILNKDNYDFDLAGIDRMEVIRGPQTTLHGRNTMGGLINIYTLSPLHFTGVKATAEYSSGVSARASLTYSQRFNPSLAMLWTASAATRRGFFRNERTGAYIDPEKSAALRWKTAWRVDEELFIENVASVSYSSQGGYPYMSAETGRISRNDTCFYHRTSVADGVTLKWLAPAFTLASITSVQYMADNMTLDQDFTPDDYFTLTQRRHEWAVTHDVVIRGREQSGPYRWLAGLFGFYKHTSMSAPVTFKPYGIDQLIVSHRNEANPDYPIAWDDDSFVLGSDFGNHVGGVSLYHESYLTFGRFDITAGLRVDYEHNRLDYRSHTATSFTTFAPDGSIYSRAPIDIDDSDSFEKNFVQFSPKLTVSYRLSVPGASSLYATVARGYKAGGYNVQMFSDVLQQRLMATMGISSKYRIADIISYRPEQSWNFEVGTHSKCADGRVVTDVALFYIACADQQLTVFPPGQITGRMMTNAGSSRSLGAEFTVKANPTDRLALNVSYGFTDARFRRYNNGRFDLSGRHVPYAPSNTLFASAFYTQPVSSQLLRSLTLGASVRGVGRIWWDDENALSQPFYAQVGAYLNFEFSHINIDFWTENLNNSRFFTFYFKSIGHNFFQRGLPRRLGVTLRYTFNN